MQKHVLIEQLRKLATEIFDILLIESNPTAIASIELIFKSLFPLATITLLKKEEWPEINSVIEGNTFKLISVCGRLGSDTPEHDTAGTFAVSAIPFFKRHDPKVVVLAFSTEEYVITHAKKLGADVAMMKDKLIQIYTMDKLIEYVNND